MTVLKFDKISLKSKDVNISIDGGKTYKSFSVSDIKKNDNRIILEEDISDFSQIFIKGKFKTFTDIDVAIRPNNETNLAIVNPDGFASQAFVKNELSQEAMTRLNAIADLREVIDSNTNAIGEETSNRIKLSHSFSTACDEWSDTIQSINDNIYSVSNTLKEVSDDITSMHTQINDNKSAYDDLQTVTTENKQSCESLTTQTENLQKALSNETSARKKDSTDFSSKIEKLQSDIIPQSEISSQIESAITSKSKTLQDNIDKEHSDRLTSLDNLSNEVTENHTSLSNSINLINEETDRLSSLLDDAVSSIESTDSKLDSNLTTINTAINTHSKDISNIKTELKDKLPASTLTRITALETGLSDESTARATLLDNINKSIDAGTGAFISKVSQTKGTLSADTTSFDTKITSTSLNAPTSKAVYDAISNLGTVFAYKGSVANYSALPTNAKAGYVYNLTDTDDNYVWTGSAWDKLGGNTSATIASMTGSTTSSGKSATTFVSAVTQTNGKIAATTSTLPSASTSSKGIVKLQNNLTTATDSSTNAVTASTVISAVDAINTKIDGIISDSATSGAKVTWSIDKIKSAIPSVTSVISDSTTSSTSKTWSIDKIKSAIPSVTDNPAKLKFYSKISQLSSTDVDKAWDYYKDEPAIISAKNENDAAIAAGNAAPTSLPIQVIYFALPEMSIMYVDAKEVRDIPATIYGYIRLEKISLQRGRIEYLSKEYSRDYQMALNSKGANGTWIKIPNWSDVEALYKVTPVTKTVTVSNTESSRETPYRDFRYLLNNSGLKLYLSKASVAGSVINIIANADATLVYPNNKGVDTTVTLAGNTVTTLYATSSGYISNIYGAAWN